MCPSVWKLGPTCLASLRAFLPKSPIPRNEGTLQIQVHKQDQHRALNFVNITDIGLYGFLLGCLGSQHRQNLVFAYCPGHAAAALVLKPEGFRCSSEIFG